jgi:hypothetical protein
MGRYLLWATLPGMILGAVLQEWLGGFGVALTFVVIVIGWLIWVRLIDKV